MFPIQEREEVMDYTELKKLMSEQKVEMTAAERIKAYNAVSYTHLTLPTILLV